MPPTSAADVLLVIPCYRESGRIGAFLDELAERMTALGGVRIRVVEDGSDPEEQQRMRAVIDAQSARHALSLKPICRCRRPYAWSSWWPRLPLQTQEDKHREI